MRLPDGWTLNVRATNRTWRSPSAPGIVPAFGRGRWLKLRVSRPRVAGRPGRNVFRLSCSPERFAHSRELYMLAREHSQLLRRLSREAYWIFADHLGLPIEPRRPRVVRPSGCPALPAQHFADVCKTP